MELTKEILEDIIKQFAEEGKIFSNEAQFQFELAWALREYKDKKGNKLFGDDNDKVKLEHLSIENKMYTDIVVRVDNKYYPIELKYKTADKQIKYKKGDLTKITYLQGAHDDASYDYLKDVERLEKIVINKQFTPFDGESNFSIEKGFAIIISNEPKIWGEGVRNITKSPRRDYYLFSSENAQYCPYRTIEKNSKLGWVDKNTGDWFNSDGTMQIEKQKNERFNAITLGHEYKLEWKDYMNSENPFSPLSPSGYEEVREGNARKGHPFKYMIVVVTK
ncbi:MAG: hypothetical protein IJI67_06215 [Clostridia bacterium]|nr:hypothetical protein [Clostridia bacterium]